MSLDSKLDRLLDHLGAGVSTTVELERLLLASKSWVTGRLQALITQGRVIRLGTTRGARYGLRRDIAGIGSAWPLYRVGREGAVEEMGMLYALEADQFYLESASHADRGFAAGGLHSGLPYLLQDQRPAGFLGRAIPRRHPELALPQRVRDWTDAHYLSYLVRHGSDTVGDLILGAPALDEFIAAQAAPSLLRTAERGRQYPRWAEEVMQGGLPGSSAQGEHPKFTALIHGEHGAQAVLVKFSPPMNEPAGRRWADLLVAEHHAAQLLQTAGVPTVVSRLFQFADRTYLETDRFDRAGAAGRVGVTSLFAIDTALHGRLDDWIAAASRLFREARIDAATLERVRLAFTFGGLIGNTDRHFGNLAFFDRYDGRFELAPIYDMLPMLFAPEHDQILSRLYVPQAPVAVTMSVWPHARALAQRYWHELAADLRVSAEFRRLCEHCAAALDGLPRTGVYAAAARPAAGTDSI